MTDQKTHIAIAEDNLRAAAWLISVLNKQNDLELVFHAKNGKELCDFLQDSADKPDLILMDIEMPVMNGIEATRWIKTHFPEIKITSFTNFDNDEAVFEMIKAGATGYLLKDIEEDPLIQQLAILREGGAPMSPSIALKIIQHIQQETAKKTSAPLTELTVREREVLYLIKDGLQNKEIADRLHISPLTVRKHLENIYSKLHVSNRIEAINLLR